MSTATTEREVIDLDQIIDRTGARIVVLDRAVKRGAQFLDQWREDWFTLVDTEHIEMSSANQCVLGQFARAIGGGYWHALDTFAVPYVAERWRMKRAMREINVGEETGLMAASYALGFDNLGRNLGMLRALWIGQIMRRQIEAGG